MSRQNGQLKYFRKEASAERIRWIFSEELRKPSETQETEIQEAEYFPRPEAYEIGEDDEGIRESGSAERANSCDTFEEAIVPGERGVSNCLLTGELSAGEMPGRPLEYDTSAATPTIRSGNRDTRFRRLVVRARNPNGSEIETAIVASGPEQEAGSRKAKEREAEISRKSGEVEELEKHILETVTEVSRLQAVVDEQYRPSSFSPV